MPSPLSPAYLAGLLPYSDYILGSPAGTLRGESALGELVEDHLNRTLTLWVYNSEFDVVREVQIVPSRGWGGEGALGAMLGYGALHRLPVGLGEEVAGPGEVMFDMKQREAGEGEKLSEAVGTEQGNFFVPANMLSPPPPPMMDPSQAPKQSPSPAPARHGRRNRHAAAAGVSFDDYFRESEQKSKEEDYVPSRHQTPVPPPPKGAGVPPPPPKAGSSEKVESDSSPQTENPT